MFPQGSAGLGIRLISFNKSDSRFFHETQHQSGKGYTTFVRLIGPIAIFCVRVVISI